LPSAWLNAWLEITCEKISVRKEIVLRFVAAVRKKEKKKLSQALGLK
jgi:hypothetical protein